MKTPTTRKKKGGGKPPMSPSPSSQHRPIHSTGSMPTPAPATPDPLQRRSLHRKTPSLSSYQTTPISKHYQLNNHILAAFESNYENKIYNVAYAMGLQFVETALLEIPKHGYFHAQRHERERMESSLEAVRVTQILSEIQSDHRQQLGTTLADEVRIQKLRDLAVAQVEKASEDQFQYSYEEQRAQAERELRIPDDDASGLCEPMLVAYDSLTNVLCPPNSTTSLPSPHYQQQQQLDYYFDQHNESKEAEDDDGAVYDGLERPWKSDSAAMGRQSARSPVVVASGIPVPPPLAPHGRDASTQSTTSTAAAVPPPLLRHLESDGGSSVGRSVTTPMTTLRRRDEESSHDLPYAASEWIPLRRQPSTDEILLEKALYVSGLEVTPTTSLDMDIDQDESRVPPPDASSSSWMQDNEYSATSAAATPTPGILHFETVSNCYHEDFDHLIESGLIRISYASTYQGRVSESTNGCTVIAPLLCIHHMFADVVIPDPGLPDAVIEQAIDEETPAILKQLRDKLGLSAQAFLIPSDAHDYLIQNGQLWQEQFINVTGGNILDEDHLSAFVDALEKADHQKVAATLFFHEHVVAIIKIRRGGGSCWYDLIDGLPGRKFLTRVGESEHDFTRRLYLTESQDMLSGAFVPKTARIRCLNPMSLTACVRWYACSKFSPDNITYIDQYAFDDKSCDFDPRVFQGFLWGSKD